MIEDRLKRRIESFEALAVYDRDKEEELDHCYVWVRGPPEDPSVCDCQRSHDRRSWRRSEEPIGPVKMIAKSKVKWDWQLERKRLSRGLQLDICIQITQGG